MSTLLVNVHLDSIEMTLLGRQLASISGLKFFKDYADAADKIIDYTVANQVTELRVSTRGIAAQLSDLLHARLRDRRLEKYIILWEQVDWSVKTLERS